MITDVNDSKHFWKIAVRITKLWFVQKPPNSGHLYRMEFNADTIVERLICPAIPLFEYEFKKFAEIVAGQFSSDCPTIVSSSWCGSELLIGEEINDIGKFSSLRLWFDQFSERQRQLPSPQSPLSKWEKRKSDANDSQQLKTAVSFTAEHDPDHLEVITSAKRMWGELDLDLAQSPLQSSSEISSSNVAKHMKTK
ncbi:hypothetical protein Lal_00033807 [Lupinus albus]|nr:hypothetical protein Lal_00033807 [Lupinus albus]